MDMAGLPEAGCLFLLWCWPVPGAWAPAQPRLQPEEKEVPLSLPQLPAPRPPWELPEPQMLSDL